MAHYPWSTVHGPLSVVHSDGQFDGHAQLAPDDGRVRSAAVSPCQWSVRAAGQSVPLVSPCQWSVHAACQSMPLVSPCRVVSPCQWSVRATGQSVPLGSPCQWSVCAGGQFVPLVSPCQWSVRAGGQFVPLVSPCRWSVRAAWRDLKPLDEGLVRLNGALYNGVMQLYGAHKVAPCAPTF